VKFKAKFKLGCGYRSYLLGFNSSSAAIVVKSIYVAAAFNVNFRLSYAIAISNGHMNVSINRQIITSKSGKMALK
jgi:hypothetical protein